MDQFEAGCWKDRTRVCMSERKSRRECTGVMLACVPQSLLPRDVRVDRWGAGLSCVQVGDRVLPTCLRGDQMAGESYIHPAKPRARAPLRGLAGVG